MGLQYPNKLRIKKYTESVKKKKKKVHKKEAKDRRTVNKKKR